jgi:translation elongation factor EF-1beta
VPDEDAEESREDELLEEFDEVDNEVAAMSAAALAYERDPGWFQFEWWRDQWQAHDEGVLNRIFDLFEETIHASPEEALLRQEIADYATLAEAFKERPENKVKLFDLEGQPVGFGLKAGEDDRGTLIQVAEDAVDVTARAEDANGPIANAVFVHVRPTADE